MSYDYSTLNIETESDVEQKLIYKLITNPLPTGLGYSNTDFKTKPDIRKITIDKGKKQRLYYPDYVIIIDGVPSLIIEAKAPNEDLNEALREGRLYATEINSNYPHNVNPCEYVLVSNGTQILLTKWDSIELIFVVTIKDINPSDPNFSKFTDLISKVPISKHAKTIRKKIRKNAKYFKPVFMLGGKSVINQSIGENSFGTNVAIEYKYLFNPETQAQRDIIVKYAYVPSKRRESHISPIDKIIRAAIPPSHLNARVINDTKKPQELFEELFNKNKIKNELCLLIGSVGSGKSTFMSYLNTIALPKELAKSTEWITINLNDAPLSRNLIYNWVVKEAINEIRDKNPNFDFDDLRTLKVIYKDELDKIKKGRAALFSKNSEKYAEIIYEELKKLQDDIQITLKAIIKYIFTKKEKLLILILDNCDKKSRDDQLLMFEVATWLKREFTCSVFLPLRDYTYDVYCNHPPLDTVVKDLVFKIDPPLLQKVIYERLKYAIREIDNENHKFIYHLSNGMKVSCERKEISNYLNCMISSLFQNNLFRRIIIGLAGRNIRLGLEIFLEFCKSAHISEDEIFKIRQSNGTYQLHHHIIYNALLRRRRMYYDDQHAYIKNLFSSYNEDDLPDPFIRLYILLWLKERYREYGSNNTRGYHKASELIKALQMNGHSYDRILTESEKLANAGCILSESLEQKLSVDDLISISPTGIIHLDLLRNIYYLSSIAEDTYFRDNQIAIKIKDNMLGEGPHKKNSQASSISTSKQLIDYLTNYHDKYFPNSINITSDSNDQSVLHSLKEFIDKNIKNAPDGNRIEKLIKDYPPGSQFDALVVVIKEYGLFVEFGLEGIGLIHLSQFKGLSKEYLDCFEIGDWVKVELIKYNNEHKKFDLCLIDYY